jgi:hypothetical protein
MFNMVDEGMRALLTKAGAFLDRAVDAREAFYGGMDEAAHLARTERHPNMGPTDAKYRFAKSVKGQQLINDNKWHMAQARTWSLMAIAKGIFVLVVEQRRTNKLLEENNTLLKEVRNALRSR